MSQESLKDFCKRWLAAWSGNRPDELIKFYDPSAYYQDPANPGGLRGHAQILPYFQKLLAKNPDWRWSMNLIFPVMEGFVVKWDAEIPLAAGKNLRTQGMDLVLLRDRIITRNEVYFDASGMKS
ncbi:MAG: nuclear transport factor 2 family protein [Bdellovibrionales bacterium]|nr:nuclear transport factor 2 family protein [Bdellovibrionales bacterium]